MTPDAQHQTQERVPTAWGEFWDGHDYSRTGKHDPNNCRSCLRHVVAALEAEIARLREYVQHTPECESWPQFTSHFAGATKQGPCTCGLDPEGSR